MKRILQHCLIFKIEVLKSLIVPFSVSMMFSSCIKDDFDFNKMEDLEWSPEIAAPLVNSTLTFKDMLGWNPAYQVETDELHFCTLVYSDTLYTLNASDILSIKEQDIKFDFSMDNNLLSAFNMQGSADLDFEQHISFKANQTAELDSVFFKAGALNLDFISTFKQNVILKIKLPGLKKDGIAFSRAVNLDYQSTLPVNVSVNLSLKDYLLDITNNGTAVNDLTILYNIKIAGNGNPASLTDRLTVDGGFKNLQFDAAYGYLGQMDFAGDTDTLAFDFLDNRQGLGSFTLADPKINVSVINSVGIPVRGTIPELTGYNNSGGAYDLGSSIPNPLPVYSPLVGQFGQSLTGTFQLNNQNSNLVQVISHLPEYFLYQVHMKTNPDGKKSQNFLTGNSRMSLFADIELPLYGSASNFIISDTNDFEVENIKQLESMTLRSSFNNGFPFDIAVQAYFTDDKGVILDSLITGDRQIIKSGKVDIFTGRVVKPEEKTTDTAIDAVRMNRIKNAKRIITMGTAATTSNGTTNVKMYSDYAIGIKIGIRAQVKMLQ